jgi:hypothetical protein
MAVQIKTFTQNLKTLSAESYTYTSDFAASIQLGQIAIAALESTIDLSSGIETTSPISKGLQENVEVWVKHSAGSSYNYLLYAASFNGRKSLIFTPASPTFLNSGSELMITVYNRHKFGTIFGSIMANPI